MKQLIYVEGPDGSGKSTRIRELMAAHEGPAALYHNGVYTSSMNAFNAYMHQMKFFDQVNIDQNWMIIMDRGPYAEQIYGPIMRDTRMNGRQIDDCLELLNHLKAEFIICLPPYEVCKSSWEKRKDEEYVKDPVKYQKIYDQYELLAQYHEIERATIYDYTA